MQAGNNEVILRGNIYWVNLDLATGSEIQKTRPAVVISNSIQNKVASRVIVVHITSNVHSNISF